MTRTTRTGYSTRTALDPTSAWPMAVFLYSPPWQLEGNARRQRHLELAGCGGELEDGLVAAKDGAPLRKSEAVRGGQPLLAVVTRMKTCIDKPP